MDNGLVWTLSDQTLATSRNRSGEPPIQPSSNTQWLGPAVFLVAMGSLGQAWISYQGRTAGSSSSLIYYITLCLIYTPSAIIVMSRKLNDNVKLWFVLYMSLGLLATRFLQYPNLFAYHDELVHQGVAQSINNTNHLFGPNTILPEAADYPGLEIATTAIQHFTDLPLHASGVVVLGAARIIMTVALIRIIERITGSAQAGCIAALVYTANQEYIFFNSQFSYASLALSLAFFALYLFSCRAKTDGMLALVPCGAVTVALAATHHLTSLAFAILLWTWYFLTRFTKQTVPKLLPFAAISLFAVAVWTWFARSLIIPYIGNTLRGNLSSIINLLHGNSGHKFFSNNAGFKNPEWEAIVSIVSVLIVVLVILLASWYAVRRLRLLSASGILLVAMTICYPVIPVGHFTDATAEVADRSAPFLFVGIGYVVAVWWLRQLRSERRAKMSRLRRLRPDSLLVVCLTFCFVGGTIIGGADWTYVPGKYLVSADNRSIDQVSLAAGYWEARTLPSNSRVYTDRENGLIAQAYGNLHVVTAEADGIDEGSVSTLLLRPLKPSDRLIVCAAKIQYIVADSRLATNLPELGLYIDSGEYLYGTRTVPPAASDLIKFDNIRGAERVYDNGTIRIFGVGGLSCPGPK